MPIDLPSLWDFSKPELSEQRFRDALATATPDDALILHTQIARTHGLRRDFARAQEILTSLEPRLAAASPEARVRHAIEWGRSLCSTTHPPETQTPEAKEQARAAYTRAFDIARAARLDDLAIDALHMMAMVDSAPEDQLRWGLKALEVLEASDQPAAKKWEGSLRNNLGYALRLLGRHDEALAQFELALAFRERMGRPGPIRVAHWMIARTFRDMGRIDEAVAIQSRLEKECETAGEPDEYVFEELEHLHRARGDAALADAYAAKRKATR